MISRVSLFLVLLSDAVMAEDSVKAIGSVDPVNSSYISRITLGLVIILLLIFLLAWVMKKMQLTPQSGQQLIQIVSAISVGHRDRIALIQVGDEQILVGLTPGRIEKLHELKSCVEELSLNKKPQHRFADKFSQIMQRNKNTVDSHHDH